MPRSLYSTALWRIARARAIQRDGKRCSVARLLGGDCSHGSLHVHHLVPVDEGGPLLELDNLLTTCRRHHPMLEALRRHVLATHGDAEQEVRCPHRHVHAEARKQCEARLRKQRQLAA